MNYKLVTGGINQLVSMETQINQLIDVGWEVVGELKVATAEGQTVFVQQLKYIGPIGIQPSRLPDTSYMRNVDQPTDIFPNISNGVVVAPWVVGCSVPEGPANKIIKEHNMGYGY
jgi:hypothetical protein